MKTEGDHSMKDKKSKGYGKMMAFAAGAAAGVAVGMLIASDKGGSFRDKVKSFIREADGSREDKPEEMVS